MSTLCVMPRIAFSSASQSRVFSWFKIFWCACSVTQCLMLRLGQLQSQNLMTDEHASLAKAFCTVKCRETVGYARELLGGNGILLDNHVGRFVADAEAIYSYEGTREMNTLIVGKAITGLSAFV